MCPVTAMFERKTTKLLTFWTFFGAVLVVFVLKGVLLMGRYGITASGRRCELNETDNRTMAVVSKVSHEFIFTTTVYAIASVLRFVEYFLLGKQFYIFLFKQEDVNVSEFFTKHSNRYWFLLVFAILLLPYLLLGLIIPSLGIYQEMELTNRLEKCYRHYHEIYISYCIINALRYLSAYSVRFTMMFATLVLSKYWFPDHVGPPRHTSIGHSMRRKSRKEADKTDTVMISSANKVTRPDGTMSVISNEGLDQNNQVCEKVLQDWRIVSSDFREHSVAYAKIGKEAKVINELFRTWFIVPWAVYFIASSLKSYNIFRPWNTDGDGDTPPSNIPQIYYLLYNINQFITLLIPYLCAKKINTYHQKYYKQMRNRQLERFEDDPSRLSFARQLLIEKEEDYDFVPRIVGTSITISIGSPLYVVILLAGLFLSVTESLF